jgi:23S rRNA pseudouridine2605 synthase
MPNERLQKFLSQAGVSSRRHAEEMIKRGEVKVNGKIVREMGHKIDPGKDRIEVLGRSVKAEKGKIYIMLNKPRKYLTTRNDPKKRKTVYDLLPNDLKNKVWPVGRLDYLTEGLLLLTNDGDLTQTLTHPSKEHEKEYEVELDKRISDGKLEKIRSGILLDGRKTSPAKVIMLNDNKLRMIIHEGWNRQIRRMFSVIGLTVRNLKRLRVGKLKLQDLPLGRHKKISLKDIM